MNAERLLAHYERIADAPNAVARLRRFILDLAVRGKLMPQDPKDEPASELLKKIAAAKARLARTGRDVFDEGDLVGGFRFEVPRLWCWSEIETVAYVEMGQSPPSDHYNQRGDGIAFFQGKADFGARNPTPRYWCTQPTKFAEAGDILISVRAPVVPTNVASQRCCIGRGLAALRPYEGLDRDFLLLSLRAFEGDLASLGFGTTFVAINKKHLTMFPIPLPPLVEQKRIVAKVDELMALCDQLDKARAEREATRDRLAAALLGRLNAPDPETFHDDARFALSALPSMTARPDQVKQLRQTILSLAVRGKLVLQDPNCEPVLSIIEAIRAEGSPLPTSGKASKAAKASATVDIAGVPFTPPIGWAWQRIDALVRSVKHDIRTGPFGSSLHKADHRQHGVPVWGIESISKAGVFIARNKIFVTPQKARELSSFSVKRGDIIISRSGTVGEICRVPDNAPDGLLSTNLMKISLDFRVISPEYFCLLFKGANSIDEQLTELCSGSTRLFLTQAILAKLLFPLPPPAEQKRIVAKVDELMSLCDRLEAGLTKSGEVRGRLLDALLHEALEPASSELEANVQLVTA